MIFVCVGSREYQFNRLLKAIDELVEQGRIQEKIIAQIGQSEYVPKHYEWHRFFDRDTFKTYQCEANLIISHAGAGALVSALKLGKQVISVPRRGMYNEHIDDHQMQISKALSDEGYLREVLDMDKLGEVIELAYKDPIIKKYEKASNIVEIVDDFLSK